MSQEYIQNKKLNHNSSDVQRELLDSLKNIRATYTAKMPVVDYGGLEKLNASILPLPTQTEIEKQAIDSLSGYYKNTKAKIDSTYQQSTNTLKNDYQKADREFSKNIADNQKQVQLSKDKLLSKGVAQGIQDSSIIDNHIDDISKNAVYQQALLGGDYAQKLSSLEFRRNVIENERDLALSNFDISYANKLNQQINTLTSQYNKALKNAQDYQKIIDDAKQMIHDDWETQYGETVKNLTQQMQRDMTYDAFTKLKDLPRAQAQQILNTNPEIKEYLGEWYSALRLWLAR